jgi:hypothetical protein
VVALEGFFLHNIKVERGEEVAITAAAHINLVKGHQHSDAA